eukprot:TRINITY_DN2322_c0_g1_i1.p1 TRINITY_DN2322_c0_g1~~TRINITY_DN2322_c0_g1_i1.p1  ORF type:complete len:1308 (-),score=122.76 TRINITY_DN2322_c0_g1_i1:5-3928(-)
MPTFAWTTKPWPQMPVVKVLDYNGNGVEDLLVYPLFYNTLQQCEGLLPGIGDPTCDIIVTNASGMAQFSHIQFNKGDYTDPYVTFYAISQTSQVADCQSQRFHLSMATPVKHHMTQKIDSTYTAAAAQNIILKFQVFNESNGVLEGMAKYSELSLLDFPQHLNDPAIQQSELYMYNFTELAGTITLHLSMKPGSVGAFAFGITTAGYSITPVMKIDVTSPVTQLAVVVPPSPIHNLTLNEPFTIQPAIQISVNPGMPLDGYRVKAQLCDSTNATLGRIIDDNNLVATTLSEPSNASGIASFKDLGLLVAQAGEYQICFYYAQDELYSIKISSDRIATDQTIVLQIVGQPPANVAINANFSSAPSVIVRVKTGQNRPDPPLTYIAGRLSVLRDNSELVGMNGYYDRSSNGVLTFDEVEITTASSDPLQMIINVAGVTQSFHPLKVTSAAADIFITSQPSPSLVYVGQIFRASITVTIAGGGPLRNHPVTAFVAPSFFGHAELSPVTAVNSTDINGVIDYTLVLDSATEGAYQIQFRSNIGAVTSQPSIPIYVKNVVAEVEILTQPGAAGGGSVMITHSAQDAKSLKQPKVRVLDSQGNPIPGKLVSVMIITDSAARVTYDRHVTNRDGEYQFSNLRLTDGGSGTYQFVFQCQGISSKPSDSFVVYNAELPDSSNYGNMQNWAYIWTAIMVPLFIFNSAWLRSKLWFYFGLIGSVGVVLGYFLYNVLILIAQYTTLGNPDPFWQTLRINTTWILMLPILSIGYVMVLVWLLPDSRYHKVRMQMHRHHVKKLFLPPTVLGIIRPEMRYQVSIEAYWKAKQSTADRWYLKLLYGLKAFFAFGSGANYHAPLEQDDDYMYPQRFIIGSTLALAALFYVTIGGVVLVYLVIYAVERGYNMIVNTEVSFLINRFNQQFDPEGNGVFGQLAGQVFASIVLILVNSGEAVIGSLKNRLERTGLGSVCAAAIVCLIMWYFYFRTYRATVMGLRHGKHRHFRQQFSFMSATSYVGMQIANMCLGFLLLFLVIWLAAFVVSFHLFWSTLWHYRDWIIGRIFGTWLIMYLIKLIIVRRYFLNGPWEMRHRSWFALFDYFNTFISVVTSLVGILMRLAMGVVLNVICFTRLDIPIIGVAPSWDAGYSCFIATAVCDAHYNHPVFCVFNDMIIKDLRHRQKRRNRLNHEVYDEKHDRLQAIEDQWQNEVKRRRAIRRWHLFVLLAKNPQLCQLRKQNTHNLEHRGWENIEDAEEFKALRKQHGLNTGWTVADGLNATYRTLNDRIRPTEVLGNPTTGPDEDDDYEAQSLPIVSSKETRNPIK